MEEEYFGEEPNECCNCRKICEETPETVACQFCQQPFPTGRSLYRCKDCDHEWIVGSRKHLAGEKNAVCAACQTEIVGDCAVCGKSSSGSQSRDIDGAVVCNDCLKRPETIWCPACGRTFPYWGYLKGVFREDRPGLHAAALVTHYRHNHVKSHDRAWQDHRYRATIPGYDYDERKTETNNQAKRQLIKAITGRVDDGSYPEAARIGARELVGAFGRLQGVDEATEVLITATLKSLARPSRNLTRQKGCSLE
jgi:hypothetical protein